jgi:CheY-like chemotaxis protein
VIARLRTLLPPALGVHGVTTARDAITTLREKTVKVALIDYELPDVTAAQFTSQLKLLQPSTVLLAMTLRGSAPPGVLAAEARAKGFADVLFKPFSPESIEDFLQQHFAPKDVLSREDNVLKVPAFAGSAERQEKYFTQLASLIAPELETIASACFAGAVLDLSRAPFNAERIPRLMKQVGEKAKAMGLNLCLVGSPEVRAALREFEETKDLRIFGGLAEARAEAG